LRQRGIPSWDSILSDDGAEFLPAAWSSNPISLIWEPYAGYLQVSPRLLAIPLVLLPLSWAAAYIAIVSAIVSALLGVFVVIASEGLVRQRYLRWSLGLLATLGPFMGGTPSLAEIQFPLVFASFWAIISISESRRFLLVRIVLVVLAGLSSAIAFALIPIALVMVILRRQRSDLIIIGALMFGLLAQMITLLTVSTPDPLAQRTLDGIIGIYGQRVVAAMVVGEGWLEWAWLQFGVSISIYSAVAVVIGIGVWAANTKYSQWIYSGLALALSPVLMILSLNARGLVPLLIVRTGFFTLDGERYFVIPILLLASGLILLAGGPPREVNFVVTRAAVIFRVALAVQIIIIIVVGFRIDTIRSPGPRWGEQIERANKICQIDKNAPLYLLFSPTNFNVRIKCSDL